MDLTLPPLVTTRQSNWRANPSVSLEAKQETADYFYEAWDSGRLDFPIRNDVTARLQAIKQRKDKVHPSTAGKIKEELLEAAEETGAPVTGGLMHIALARHINPFMVEDIQHMLGMPIIPIETYLTAAAFKLEGRIATNEANPTASSQQVKSATKDYEATSARKAFNMEA